MIIVSKILVCFFLYNDDMISLITEFDDKIYKNTLKNAKITARKKFIL